MPFPRQTIVAQAIRASCVMLALGLSACSSIDNLMGNEKVDYRTTGTKTPGLEVPPDLTQLARDSRYQTPQGGTISATTFQGGGAVGQPVVAAVNNDVAPKSLGNVRLVREGNSRWIAVNQPPDQLWPQLQAFWKESGFSLSQDQPAVGVMETEWNENRAKLPKDIIRNTIGRVFDSLYSTGERDKYRTRVERTASGSSEVYISHRGMEEVYTGTGAQRDSTIWQPRAPDPELEGEFLQRLMVKLGAKDEQAKTAVATTGSTTPARARAVSGEAAATMQVDDSFDRAWRRVGLALDRSGFTVEDRDRAQGIYFVRYVDPALAGKDEPGFFGKLFTFGKSTDFTPARYRVVVKGAGEQSTVSVLNSQGAPEKGEAGTRIVRLLVEDLK